MKAALISEKSTAKDCHALFATHADDLSWLCRILTGDQRQAETVLSSALEQSLLDAGQVFRGWMLNWARRLIIKHCIAVVRPAVSQISPRLHSFLRHSLPLVELKSADNGRVLELKSLPREVLQDELLRLSALSRFVFVMRAIAGYSRREAALLLNLDDRTCEWIYTRAVMEMSPCEGPADFGEPLPQLLSA